MNFWENLEQRANEDGIIKKVVGGIIKNKEGKILFLRRNKDDFMGGIVELPSGNVEAEETILEGLIREIKEETNLEVENIGMFINTFDYLSKSGKKSRQFNFEVKVKEFTNIFLTEHDEYSWLSLEEIENNKSITEEVKHTIQIFKYNNECR